MTSNIERLALVLTHLKIHITTICTFPVFDPEIIQEEIDSEISEIEGIFNKDLKLSANESELLSKIHLMALTLYQMLNERLTLQSYIRDSFEVKPDHLDLKWVTNATQEGTSPTHRLAKEQVQVLDKWYNDNFSEPFLNARSVKNLKEQTGLRGSQIRNWYVQNKDLYRSITNSCPLQGI